jgi:hypothetical protein
VDQSGIVKGAELNYRILRSFNCAAGDGQYPQCLTEGSDGALYGGVEMSCPADDQTIDDEQVPRSGFIFRVNKDGSGFTQLHTFSGASWGGAQSFFEGSDSYLYGTAELQTLGFAVKQVFKMKHDGSSYQVVHGFDPYGDGAGDVRHDTLYLGKDSLLYGIHFAISENPASASFIFKASLDGSNYSLVITGSEPAYITSLLPADDGFLYGTSTDFRSGKDTLFKIRSDGTDYRSIYNADGCGGCLQVLLAKEGLLYATGPDGFFQLQTDGGRYQMIGPVGATKLFEWSDGFLYGTDGAVIFRLRKDGGDFQTVLKAAFPDLFWSDAFLASNGRFYIATRDGGQYGNGAIFVTAGLANLPRLLGVTTSFPKVLGRFAGPPGSTNEIQRAKAVAGPWEVFSTVIVPVNGIAAFTDPAPPANSAFYRVLQNQ